VRGASASACASRSNAAARALDRAADTDYRSGCSAAARAHYRSTGTHYRSTGTHYRSTGSASNSARVTAEWCRRPERVPRWLSGVPV
jgi:hypothetical protein